MAFDECTEYPAERSRAEESLRLTMAWARRSLDHFRAHREEVVWREELGGKTQSLFGIVQGGMYADLRRESAERLVEMDFDGYAIGGLSVGEPREADARDDFRSVAVAAERQAAVRDGRWVSRRD
jgi:queuine tRNA-ribosyltransferase